ncbi:hypothetical protein CLV43_101436 [Umezawaea tangerina]|uniref:Uncharacterized protein n=1 Tax=Umezawaea tangerina TaxID=84725 RepID=A0A2T0TKK4_9PSEU|nr:hypothetical protein CLV43_101436 [Umezawaea tangerina]
MSPWIWFFSAYAIFTLTVAGYAARAAVSYTDASQRADAYKVLKLIWGMGTGTGGLIGLVIKAHESGLL